jgi:hypothetical protein
LGIKFEKGNLTVFDEKVKLEEIKFWKQKKFLKKFYGFSKIQPIVVLTRMFKKLCVKKIAPKSFPIGSKSLNY